jgi:hypothetical protein
MVKPFLPNQIVSYDNNSGGQVWLFAIPMTLLDVLQKLPVSQKRKGRRK